MKKMIRGGLAVVAALLVASCSSGEADTPPPFEPVPADATGVVWQPGPWGFTGPGDTLLPGHPDEGPLATDAQGIPNEYTPTALGAMIAYANYVELVYAAAPDIRDTVLATYVTPSLAAEIRQEWAQVVEQRVAGEWLSPDEAREGITTTGDQSSPQPRRTVAISAVKETTRQVRVTLYALAGDYPNQAVTTEVMMQFADGQWRLSEVLRQGVVDKIPTVDGMLVAPLDRIPDYLMPTNELNGDGQ